MSRTVLVAAMLVIAGVLPAGAQDSAQQPTKGAKTRATSRHAARPSAIPPSTGEHHAVARVVAKPRVTKTTPPPPAQVTQRSVASTAASSASSTRSDAFAFSRFSSRDAGTQRKPFDTFSGDSARPTHFRPFTTHNLHDQPDSTAMRTAGHDFRFRSGNDQSGTANQFEPFGLDDHEKGKRCVRVHEGAFLHTRCF